MKTYLRESEVHTTVREWGKECIDNGTVTDSNAVVDLIYRLMFLKSYVTGKERMIEANESKA